MFFCAFILKSDKERYKITLLSCLRYSLNRYLKAPPYNKKNDIVKEASFANSTDKYKAAIAELKMMGLGDVEHYPAITETDRRKLYTSLYFSLTGTLLYQIGSWSQNSSFGRSHSFSQLGFSLLTYTIIHGKIQTQDNRALLLTCYNIS
jgi:hypothetical protein